MAEQFDHRDLIITLFGKGRVPARIPGTEKIQAGTLPLEQFVEVNVRGKDGQWHQAEIPLVEFYDLMFRKVFPVAAKRIQSSQTKT